MSETIQLIRNERKGAAPYTLYVGGEFWCTCESRREAEDEIAALEGRGAQDGGI